MASEVFMVEGGYLGIGNVLVDRLLVVSVTICTLAHVTVSGKEVYWVIVILVRFGYCPNTLAK